MPAEPTDDERTAVDELLGPPETGWVGAEQRGAIELRVARGGREARERRHLLLPALHALQAHVGWISQGGLNYVCERLSVPPAEAYGVATFYAMFSVEPRPATVVHVCDDLACRVNGALELVDEMGREVGPEGEVRDGASWVRSPCLGMCEQAPVVLGQRVGRPDVALGGATIASFDAIARPDSTVVCAGADTAPQTWDADGAQELRLLRRVGHVDPTSLEGYRRAGGYEALARAIELGPERVVREVTDAKLLGRGGAAFPTGVKWKAVAEQAATPHVVIANADESEPGTFKDRLLMELDPFALVEALTIAGVATRSERGYVYLRGEYPLAYERLEHAIGEARRNELLGPDVMGSGSAFDIELRRGAGAYICGEETALFNSLEGKRGEPATSRRSP
jgi:NADH-quinone oxidoreductase subunit F